MGHFELFDVYWANLVNSIIIHSENPYKYRIQTQPPAHRAYSPEGGPAFAFPPAGAWLYFIHSPEYWSNAKVLSCFSNTIISLYVGGV